MLKSGGTKVRLEEDTMKTLRFVLLVLPLVLLALVRQGMAGPATVVMFPEDGFCNFVWGGIAQDGLPHIVLIDGRGVLTVTNNARDNRALHCDGHIAFGEVAVVFVPDLMDFAQVRLLTVQEVCSFFPDACHGAGDQGAVIFTPQNVPGFTCTIGLDAQGNPVITDTVSERVAPSGQARILCHLP